MFTSRSIRLQTASCKRSKNGTDTKMGLNFPPVLDQKEMAQQAAATPVGAVRSTMETEIPPVVRSVLELAHAIVSSAVYFRTSPGFEGGLFYQGRPYCFAGGFRDSTRPMDYDEKGNYMRLRDPIVYGALSLPITTAYLCELHGKGVFDVNKPLVEYLPELVEKLPAGTPVTARSILNFTTVVDDATVLKDAGASPWRPLFAWNACAATQAAVYEPINRFLSGGSTLGLSGRQQRENLVLYVQSSPHSGLIRCVDPRRARLSHFSVALLVAAVETQLKGTSFEDSIRSLFFERAQSHAAGYGAPKLWRNPSDIFYQSTGLARQHQAFRRPVPAGTVDNCGPPALNASLNLHAPVEDYAKLLLLSLDAILNARAVWGTPNASRAWHYDWGVQFHPRRGEIQMRPCVLSGLDYIPAAASFRYAIETELGCLGLTTCGTRSARLLAGNIPSIVQQIFVKHVLRRGVDVFEPLDLDNPQKKGNESTTPNKEIKETVDRQRLTRFLKTRDHHTRH